MMAALVWMIVSVLMVAALASIGVATQRALTRDSTSADERVRALEAEVRELRAIVAEQPALPASPTWPVQTPAAGVEPTNREIVAAETEAALRHEVTSLLGEGKKIAAIKVTRERLGLDLKDAKDWVEGIERGY